MGIQPYLISATLSLVIAQRLVRKFGERGRIGVYETLVIDENIRPLILRHGANGSDSTSLILERARVAGMHTMYEDGLAKAADGLVAKEELLRVLFDTSA
jgi:general secretion pathway protein E